MHMRFDAADFVDVNAWRVHAFAFDVMMDNGLDLGNEKRGAGFGVPDDVQVDLGVVVFGHGRQLDENGLKPDSNSQAVPSLAHSVQARLRAFPRSGLGPPFTA